jgi:predicted nuclease of predicted toxin-antitoxin system
MNLLIDENMPRSLAGELAALGFNVQDARDIGLLSQPDEDVFRVATVTDAIIITRDRGFTDERNWPPEFTAGVVFINLPDDATTDLINTKIKNLLAQRLPESLLGAITFIEPQRALSHILRRRPKISTSQQYFPDKPGDDDEARNA